MRKMSPIEKLPGLLKTSKASQKDSTSAETQTGKKRPVKK